MNLKLYRRALKLREVSDNETLTFFEFVLRFAWPFVLGIWLWMKLPTVQSFGYHIAMGVLQSTLWLFVFARKNPPQYWLGVILPAFVLDVLVTTPFSWLSRVFGARKFADLTSGKVDPNRVEPYFLETPTEPMNRILIARVLEELMQDQLGRLLTSEGAITKRRQDFEKESVTITEIKEAKGTTFVSFCFQQKSRTGTKDSIEGAHFFVALKLSPDASMIMPNDLTWFCGLGRRSDIEIEEAFTRFMANYLDDFGYDPAKFFASRRSECQTSSEVASVDPDQPGALNVQE